MNGEASWILQIKKNSSSSSSSSSSNKVRFADV